MAISPTHKTVVNDEGGWLVDLTADDQGVEIHIAPVEMDATFGPDFLSEQEIGHFLDWLRGELEELAKGER